MLAQLSCLLGPTALGLLALRARWSWVGILRGMTRQGTRECRGTGQPLKGGAGCQRLIIEKKNMTLGNGYLGSRIDEERSEMRYVV